MGNGDNLLTDTSFEIDLNLNDTSRNLNLHHEGGNVRSLFCR